MFFNLPTLLTWARIVAIPLIVGVFHLPFDDATRNIVATALFIVFALTDWLDGWLARRLNQTSSFGAFLDPVADKFLVCAALLVLVHLHRVDALVALVIIGREIAISALREWMAQIGASRSVAVHMLGKVKTVVQMVAIPFLLYDGTLFGVDRHPRVGHRADLRRRGADDLVDGVLPAQGAAGNPRPRAMSALAVARGARPHAQQRVAARDAGRVRADLEHRLRRRALRHAACAADGLSVAGAMRCRSPPSASGSRSRATSWPRGRRAMGAPRRDSAC